MKGKVLMAMSGGIDSTVSAILLREAGYELIGVTFRSFDTISQACMEREKGCCSVDSIFEARRMAETLGFEHHILDIRKEFRATVIQNFIDEYLQGHTPNPCVVCNSYVKWGLLLDMADKMECQYIATGHYAQIGEANGRYFLHKGADTAKDQTYFLWTLTQDNLARTIFPLGKLTKPQVRQIALNHGFEKLSKKTESQEICFIPDNNYRSFLAANVDNYEKTYGEGDFVGTDGRILGRHKGYPNYTIGQRKGLGIALGYPAFVVSIDSQNNRVVLGTKEDLQGREFYVSSLNMMKYAQIPDEGLTVTVRIRYRSQGGIASVYPEGERLRVVFHEPVDSITPGQSAVFFEGDDIVGGGVITSVISQ